jgi:hypothetical protein
MSLWEESCRVPLIIRAPGVARADTRAGHPVALVDLYPTLIDLCGLKGDTRKNEQGARLDGHSLRPFLADPENGTWDGPDAALSMIRAGGEYDKIAEMQHYSVRTRDFRYIRYNTGQEELYDHRNDPHEWTNLADRTELADTKAELRAKLDAMTGLKIGVVPPRKPTPLEQGVPLKFNFDEFDLETALAAWPRHHGATLTRKPGEVIDGRTSLRLQCSGNPWNTAHFKTIEIPPGMSCRIGFDCRALDIQEGGYLYYLLVREKTQTKLTRVPLKKGETKRATGMVTNDQDKILNLVIGFHKGGTYVIDNLSLSKQ